MLSSAVSAILFYRLLTSERESRQILIVVQGSRRISASIYLFAYLSACVMLRNARSTSFSVGAYSHCPYNTVSGYELLFISLDFMVQNDYGFRGCIVNILTSCEYIYTTIHFELECTDVFV